MTTSIQSILKNEDIRSYKQDIRAMSPAQIRRYFSFQSSGKLNITRLIKNIIWQAHTKIEAGEAHPISGNIRSFWYGYIKPVLSRLDIPVSGRKQTEKVYDAFIEMVTVHKLFKYSDFGFEDQNEFARVIGHFNGNLILFIEKNGLLGVVKRLALKHSATAYSSSGFPSALHTEYFVDIMDKQGLLNEPVRIFSVTDYDPSGYWIEREFIQQLKDCGVNIASVHSLVNPSLLSDEKIGICKYKLKDNSKTRNWLKITGGVNGEPYGIETDALEAPGIRQAYETAIQPYLNKSQPDTLGKTRQAFLGFMAELPSKDQTGETLSSYSGEDGSLEGLAMAIKALPPGGLAELRALLEDQF